MVQLVGFLSALSAHFAKGGYRPRGVNRIGPQRGPLGFANLPPFPKLLPPIDLIFFFQGKHIFSFSLVNNPDYPPESSDSAWALDNLHWTVDYRNMRAAVEGVAAAANSLGRRAG